MMQNDAQLLPVYDSLNMARTRALVDLLVDLGSRQNGVEVDLLDCT